MTNNFLRDFKSKLLGFLSGFFFLIIFYIIIWEFGSSIARIIGMIDPQWATAFIAFLAFIIASIGLWAGSLKGPDIILCERPRFALEEFGTDKLTNMPYKIKFEPVQLVFLNNGSRSGVIKLDIEFIPADNLKPYFDNAVGLFKFDKDTIEESMPYLSLEQGSSRIITFVLHIYLNDWKKRFETESKSDIERTLCNADINNYEHYRNFCKIIGDGISLGNISIYSRETSRKLFKIEVAEKKIIEEEKVGVISKGMISTFKLALDQWDKIEPNYVLSKIRDIEEYIDSIRTLFNQTISRLEKRNIAAFKELKDDIYSTIKNKFEGFRTKKSIFDYCLETMSLESTISDYDSKVKGYNNNLRRFQKDLESDSLRKIVFEEAGELTTESESIITKLDRLQGILRKCYTSVKQR